MGKILIIRGGAIGDFILTLPVLQALRQYLPDNHLEVIGYPHIAGLAVAGGQADQIKSIESRPLAGFFARNGRLDSDLMDYFSEFDLILSYLYDPDEIFSENIQRCTAAQFIAGPHRPDETRNLHATNTFLKPLERLAIFDSDNTPRLSIHLESAAALKLVADPPRLPADWDWIAVHPGSGSVKKNWPLEHWTRLLRDLVQKTSFNVLLVGGEAEGERLEQLATELPEERRLVARSLPLPRLALLLSQAVGFIGHDSGISHLAASIGQQGLVLWGHTNPSIWRPVSDRFELLSHPAGLNALEPEPVFQAVLERWRPAPID